MFFKSTIWVDSINVWIYITGSSPWLFNLRGKEERKRNWVKRKKLCVLALVLPPNKPLPYVSPLPHPWNGDDAFLSVTLEAHEKPQRWVSPGMQDHPVLPWLLCWWGFLLLSFMDTCTERRVSREVGFLSFLQAVLAWAVQFTGSTSAPIVLLYFLSWWKMTSY